MGAAPQLTKTIRLEKHYPFAVANHWPVEKLADKADVNRETATKFLQRKSREAREEASCQLFALTADAGAIFHGAAMRQLRRLKRLNEKPDDDWKPADFALERHTMSMIKPLLEWARIPMAGPTNDSGPAPQLSDGL